MKTSTTPQNEDTPKTTQTKSTKKSAKSRAKSNKLEINNSSSSSKNATGNLSSSTTAAQLITHQQQNNQTNQLNIVTTPTTPTSSYMSGGGVFDASMPQHGSGGVSGGSGGRDELNTTSRSNHKSYAGLEPRSIKIIWEQHDQSDVELSGEVCARVAEDASYRLWELINNIKTYARHSGGSITYDLVNEVLRDSDVPPCLGAMDSDWDRIDYDGSYFFYSDKIIELRDEYQKDVTFNMPQGADFKCSWPMEDKHMENIRKYVPAFIYVALNASTDDLDAVLTEAAFSSLMGHCYRLILTKIIQIVAFKQSPDICQRCWRLLRALSSNPQCRDVDAREEYFHLAEILICQLLAPYESIKVQNSSVANEKTEDTSNQNNIKMEIDNLDADFMDHTQSTMDNLEGNSNGDNTEKIYKLQADMDEEEINCCNTTATNAGGSYQTSQYFASPVDAKIVDELCETLGHLAAINGYFQSECLYHIVRRLERFFEGRFISTERDYNYISRAMRGLIALGEYAFREFIPFLYKLKAEDIPETLWNDFTVSAVFLQGHDDIFLYEWLEFVCGGDKLQPFMSYQAQYYEKFLNYRYLRRKPATFKFNPKLGVRRLEWSTLAAAMCHGDDPNKALKPKPSIKEVFPDLKPINMNINRAGNIRFKFAGCRPVIIKGKNKFGLQTADLGQQNEKLLNGCGQNDILIAKRRLFKPLTNEKSMIPLCSYNFLNI
ncbi:uncharacterized protein LOC111685374 [Lucilia cuprina]|uniref:uncharacterized protein LOC111685374 n=1 Tax=Lucilia cuprina TaxID=7375 RepID=UPI001F052DCA|nr:uncharacterized protein LOC111685374 [Lucilia cuprina]